MKKHKPKTNRSLSSPFSLWFLSIFFKPILFGLIDITQRHRLEKDGPYLILGNHTCMIDPILMSYALISDLLCQFRTDFNLGFVTKLLRFWCIL